MHEESFKQACVALEHYCERKGFVYQQPSYHASEVVGETLYLRNVRGDIAHYNTVTRRIRPPRSCVPHWYSGLRTSCSIGSPLWLATRRSCR